MPSFVRPFVRSFVRSSVHLFVRSFSRSVGVPGRVEAREALSQPTESYAAPALVVVVLLMAVLVMLVMVLVVVLVVVVVLLLLLLLLLLLFFSTGRFLYLRHLCRRRFCHADGRVPSATPASPLPSSHSHHGCAEL